ncbi:hypothetical protein CBL_09254 [Carabus blaptoides fortunei]
MDKIMQSWSDLQSKRRKSKMKMEGLFVFPTEQDVMNTYNSIVLDEYNMAGFDNQGTTRIRVNRFGDQQPFQLEFANEATMNVVFEYLRRVSRDESFDLGHSTTPSPPPPNQ